MIRKIFRLHAIGKKSVGKEKNTRSPSISDLSTDHLQHIFCKLPAKTLAQLRSVCKTWNAILTSPSFIALHSKNQSGFLVVNQYEFDRWKISRFNGDSFLISTYPHGRLEISRLDKSFGFLERHACPLEYSSSTRLVGSCDGLICLMEPQVFQKNFLFPCTHLWNPSIRVIKKLPTSFNVRFGGDQVRGSISFRQVCGVGVDVRSNDSKVFQSTRAKFGDDDN